MDAPLNLSWVADDLAVGGRIPEQAARRLVREHRVGAVIDVRVEACDDVEELAACGLEFLHLPTEDLCGVSLEMLDAGVAFARRMARQRRRLLVHCEHGIGRSATVALCILVDRGLEPMTALLQAKDARVQISPSAAQYEAWADWLSRRGVAAPGYHDFGCVAYRRLAVQG